MTVAILALSLVATLCLCGWLLFRRRRAEAMLVDLVDAFDFGAILVTPKTGRLLCNRLVIETLGLPAARRHVPSDHPLLAAMCADLVSGGLATAAGTKSFDIIDQDARYRRWERSVAHLPDGAVLVLLRDRTEVQELALRLEKSSGMDALTGLATRDVLLDRLNQSLEIAQRNGSLTGVLAIEIDGFTQIVDRQGWEQARRIVTDVAMRIASTTRASDTIARIGHNEFAVLLTNLPGAATAQHTARRFLDAVRIPALSAGNESFPPVPITGSVGIAIAPRDGSTALHLLGHALAACHRAVRNGGAQMAAYEAARDEDRSANAGFVGEIRKGLEAGQFFLDYQPVVDLAERHPLCFEALLRWQHPERGLMPVDEFITAAEQSGLILDLGDHALRTLCADAPRAPQGLPLSLNVSVVQLMSGDWPAHLGRILAEMQVDPEQVMIEITGTSTIANLGRLREHVAELRRVGVRVLLDDFGSGRASLSELDELGFDGLKIDRQLIYDLEDPRSREIVQMIIDYCAARDVTAIAVGIETEQQAARLLEMGCLCGQGFLFGRPAPWQAVIARTEAA